MRKFPGWRTALAAGAIAGLAVTGFATPASAATLGGHDGGHDGHGFRAQVFLLHQEGVNATTGTVKAFGPVFGRGTDIVKSQTTDLFVFRRGSLLIDHTATSDKQTVDNKACTLTIDETGTWVISSGTGKYRGARSKDGTYTATIVLTFQRKHHCRCHITPKSQPAGQTVDVTAVGKVKLHHHHHESGRK